MVRLNDQDFNGTPNHTDSTFIAFAARTANCIIDRRSQSRRTRKLPFPHSRSFWTKYSSFIAHNLNVDHYYNLFKAAQQGDRIFSTIDADLINNVYKRIKSFNKALSVQNEVPAQQQHIGLPPALEVAADEWIMEEGRLVFKRTYK